VADAVLAIKIVTDYAQGQKGLDAASSKVGRFQQGLGKLTAPAAGAALAIAAFGKSAVDAASRTEQAIGAVESVFGRNAAQVKRWADGAADSVGLAKSEYMELASVIGAQLKNMGVPLDQVAGKTNDLVKLGADLAATYGGTTKEAVEALGSALRGETDPIERYGVSVKQADIAAKQAADGTDKLTGKAAKQAKTAALLALVTQQTADAQGQFAREGDTAAVAAQKQAAQFENMQSELGTALLPALTAVTGWLTKLTKTMTKHKTATTVVIAVVAALAVGILALNVALSIYTAVTTLAASATLAAWVAAAWPILAVVAAVALLVGGIIILWKKSETFRSIVLGVWRAIKTAALATGRAVKAAWSATWNFLKATGKAVGNAVKAAFNAVKSAVKTVITTVGNLISKIRSIKVPGFIKTAIEAIKNAVKAAITTVGNLIQKLKDIKVPGVVKTALEAIKTAADKVLSVIQDIVSWFGKIKVPHIDWPSPPKWLSKVGLSVPAPEAGSPAALGRYVAPTGRSARVAGRAATVPVGGPTIVVQGALDPEAVARQIGRILGHHTRRMGGAAA
jgi:hypothetical protein